MVAEVYFTGLIGRKIFSGDRYADSRFFYDDNYSPIGKPYELTTERTNVYC